MDNGTQTCKSPPSPTKAPYQCAIAVVLHILQPDLQSYCNSKALFLVETAPELQYFVHTADVVRSSNFSPNLDCHSRSTLNLLSAKTQNIIRNY